MDVDIVPLSMSLLLMQGYGCVKCSNVLECALLICVLCQPVPPYPSTHPYIWQISFRNLFNFFVSALFCYACSAAQALAVEKHPCTCTDKWRPTASTFWPHDQKVLELCHSYVQNKAQNHNQRIPWLLVAVLNTTYRVTVLGWLKKERKKMNNSDFDRFRFATLKQLLHTAITTADWDRIYKLFYVVLDASICSPVMILP